MAHCSVPGCTNDHRYNKEKIFHRFPTDNKRRKLWIVQIKRDTEPLFQVTRNTYVCSDHFEEKFKKKTLAGLHILTKDAYPSKFKWTQDVQKRTSPKKRFSLEVKTSSPQFTMPKSCCAYNCHNHNMMKSKKVSFHRIPADKERKKNWLVAINRTNEDGSLWEPKTNNAYLCGDHFITGRANPDPIHPDYVPSIFSHRHQSKQSKCNRYALQVERRNRKERATCSASETSDHLFEIPAEDSISERKVCSMHFVDGQLTEKNPIPQLQLSHEAKVTVGRQTLVKKNLGTPKNKRQKLRLQSTYSADENRTLQEVADSSQSFSNTSREFLSGSHTNYSDKHCVTCCCNEKVFSMLFIDASQLMTNKQKVSIDACCQTDVVQCRCPSTNIQEGQELLTNITPENNSISNKLEWWNGSSKHQNKSAADMNVISQKIKLEMINPNIEQESSQLASSSSSLQTIPNVKDTITTSFLKIKKEPVDYVDYNEEDFSSDTLSAEESSVFKGSEMLPVRIKTEPFDYPDNCNPECILPDF